MLRERARRVEAEAVVEDLSARVPDSMNTIAQATALVASTTLVARESSVASKGRSTVPLGRARVR